MQSNLTEKIRFSRLAFWRNFCFQVIFLTPSNLAEFFVPGFIVLQLFFQAVDAALVRDVCFNYIYDKCPVLAAVGPIENCPDYNELRSGMYWLRV